MLLFMADDGGEIMPGYCGQIANRLRHLLSGAKLLMRAEKEKKKEKKRAEKERAEAEDEKVECGGGKRRAESTGPLTKRVKGYLDPHETHLILLRYGLAGY